MSDCCFWELAIKASKQAIKIAAQRLLLSLLPSASPAPSAAPAATVKTDHPKESKGGQVVESGAYHLEFLTEKEDTGTQLELYLQKGDSHQPVPNAKVTAQVQLPNGQTANISIKV